MMIHKTSDNNTANLGEGMSDIIVLHARFAQLKDLYRQGWIKRHGVSEGHTESVGDHIFATAMLALYVAKEHVPDLDASRAAELALIHDVCEVFAGDLTPYEKVEVLEKKEGLENDSFHKVFENTSGSEYFLDLWRELQDKKTPEALFVHDIDKLEFALQARLYQKTVRPEIDMISVCENTLAKITNPRLRKVLEEIQEESKGD